MQKISGTRWLNVYRTKHDGQLWHSDYPDRKRADEVADFHSEDDERLACIEVPWTEGQGLEAGK